MKMRIELVRVLIASSVLIAYLRYRSAVRDGITSASASAPSTPALLMPRLI